MPGEKGRGGRRGEGEKGRRGEGRRRVTLCKPSLQPFIGEINAQLLEKVYLKVFESKYVE